MSFALKIYANRNVSELYRYHDGVTFHDHFDQSFGVKPENTFFDFFEVEVSK